MFVFSYFAFERNLWDLCFVFGVSGQASSGIFNIEIICHNLGNENDFN